jgi:hypothetical protein
MLSFVVPCLQVCAKRGLLVKPFFDDAAKDDHSAKLFGHVTVSQFRQCINVKLGLRVGGQACGAVACQVSLRVLHACATLLTLIATNMTDLSAGDASTVQRSTAAVTAMLHSQHCS